MKTLSEFVQNSNEKVDYPKQGLINYFQQLALPVQFKKVVISKKK